MSENVLVPGWLLGITVIYLYLSALNHVWTCDSSCWLLTVIYLSALNHVWKCVGSGWLLGITAIYLYLSALNHVWKCVSSWLTVRNNCYISLFVLHWKCVTMLGITENVLVPGWLLGITVIYLYLSALNHVWTCVSSWLTVRNNCYISYLSALSHVWTCDRSWLTLGITVIYLYLSALNHVCVVPGWLLGITVIYLYLSALNHVWNVLVPGWLLGITVIYLYLSALNHVWQCVSSWLTVRNNCYISLFVCIEPCLKMC